ncbi:hypothetical protein DCO60_06105 [Helicobacter saguini]|nr:hypothetical protein [Helicobacter saguini]
MFNYNNIIVRRNQSNPFHRIYRKLHREIFTRPNFNPTPFNTHAFTI